MFKIVEGVVVIKFSSVKEPRLVTAAEPRLNLGSSPERSDYSIWGFC